MASLHPALSLPELLDLVFEQLSGPELAAAAVVCKHWASPALDRLWCTQVVPLGNLVSSSGILNEAAQSNASSMSTQKASDSESAAVRLSTYSGIPRTQLICFLGDSRFVTAAVYKELGTFSFQLSEGDSIAIRSRRPSLHHTCSETPTAVLHVGHLPEPQESHNRLLWGDTRDAFVAG